MRKFSHYILAATICICFSACDSPVEKDLNETLPSSESATGDNESQREDSSEDPLEEEPAITNHGDIRFSLRFLSWNVESDGADPQVIGPQLSELGPYDVVALTEVLPQAAASFCDACGKDYNYILSETGRNDRMMLIYNKKALRFVRKYELHDINFKNRYRSPLVGQFRDVLTGKELLVMVNHLARGNEKTRQIQAEKLVAWARDETLPIIALGDYNFDYVFETRKGNEGFRRFMKDSVWKWVEPIELIDTNWYDNPEEPDGKDDYPGSILDFAFVAGPAKDWTTSCKVLVRDGDFPDDEKTSDHRPFELIVTTAQ